MTHYIAWFDQLTMRDVGLVGGKNASLGEMFRELKAQGVRVPDGFAVTAEAFREYFRETGLDKEIRGHPQELQASAREENSRVRLPLLRPAPAAASLRRTARS